MSKLSQFADSFIKKSLVPSKEFGPIVLVVDHVKLGVYLTEYRIKNEIEATAVASKMRKTKGAIYFLERGLNKWNRKKVEQYLAIVATLSSKSGSRAPKLTHPQVEVG